ncbi:pathogenicity island protein [Staphylococcus pseudoxylosus]|uniref:pathogenicity island protein n=1 Tax=Staphylococcus pseudoxylosus TaxID=2282419 RepID=UPI002DBCF8AF|nr:pathogenicity island protein [Staphylococcus pseudoxylosus]MEB6170585.1 pathogenicity island protein [Staphylococcus pseudoxylosus]
MKENDLVHGQWSEWLGTFNMDRTQTHKFIKVSEEFSNVATSQQIEMNVLYEISTLPEPESTTSKGETNTPNEMTVRELRELKKQIKQRDEEKPHLESQLEQAQRSE